MLLLVKTLQRIISRLGALKLVCASRVWSNFEALRVARGKSARDQSAGVCPRCSELVPLLRKRAPCFCRFSCLMSNLYYRYPPADGSASAIPPKPSDAPAVAVSSLPFASAAGQHPGSSGSTWDATATATSSVSQSQHFPFAQQQMQQPSGQHRLHTLPLSQAQPAAQQQQQQMLQRQHQTSASLLNGRLGTADIASFPRTHDSSGEQSESTRGAVDRFGHSASNSLSTAPSGAPATTRAASSLVFDPNEFPSLAGPSRTNSAAVAAGAAAAAAAATTSAMTAPHPSSMVVVNDTQSIPSTNLGLGVVGGNAGLGVSTNAGNLGGPQPSVLSGIGPSQSAPDLPHPGLSDYSELYNLSAYASRGKAVDALTGGPPPSEFSMQSEDFPALGALGGKQPESIFGPHPTSHLTHPHGTQSSLCAQDILTVGMSPRREQPNGAVPNGNLARGVGETVPELLQQKEPSSLLSEQQESNEPPSGQAQWSSQPPQAIQGGSMTASAHSLFDTAVPNAPKTLVQQTSESPLSQHRQLQGEGVMLSESAQQEVILANAGAVSKEQSRSGNSSGQEPDHYGLKGLLRVLNPGSDATDLFLLSVGLDLTRLGLNLNSADPLHASLETPWDPKPASAVGAASAPPGSGPENGAKDEPDFVLPECYFMSPPPLKTSHFTKFQVESLFYIFYNMPRDVLQFLAAVELNNREWRYHKDLKLWFTRVPGTTAGYERGAAYIYFDISSWERLPFHDANHKFIQGLMTEEELRAARPPAHSVGMRST